ncbi:MAG TPA: hypothetical protein VGM56_31905 [Byssovorax sp.]
MSRFVDPSSPARRRMLAGALGLLGAGACGSAPRTDEQERRARPRAPAAELPFGVWTRLGPGGGGATFCPTVSPLDPERVAVASDMTGAYVSIDGGVSWRIANLRAPVRAFAWDYAARDTLYAASIGLFRSRDAGATWQLVQPDPARVRGVRMRGDHADEELALDGPPGPMLVTALACDPRANESLVLGASLGLQHGLFASSDGGATITLLAVCPAAVTRVAVDPRSPEGPARVVAVAGAHVVVVEPGATKVHAGAVELDDAAIVFPAGASPRVYACAKGKGALVSNDAGATFTALDVGEGAACEVRAVASSDRDPSVAYASFSDLGGSAAGARGVARTRDAGRSFQHVWRESRAPSPAVDDGWLSERFGATWGENPVALGVAPGDAQRVYATDMGRVLRTRDGGRVFRAVYTRRAWAGGYATTGLDVTNAHAIAFDPRDPRVVLLGLSDVGLFRSDDGGGAWRSATTNGVPDAWVNTTYAIAFDLEERGRVLAAMSDTHDLPRPKMWRTSRVASFQGGVCESRDGGVSFRAVTGLPSAAATHVLAAHGGSAAVACFGRGVFISRGGRAFEDASLGLPDEPLVYRLAHDARGALWAVLVRRTEDARPGSPEAGALYRAERPGERFERVALPADVSAPNGVAVDPNDARNVIVACWSRDADDDGPPEGGGVLFTRDGGATWTRSRTLERFAFDVTIDPRIPGRAYLAGFSSRVHRSDDGGASFAPIDGFDFKWAQRVALDLQDPSRVWVCTFGGGLWTGPADGAPVSTRVDLGA